MRIILLALTPFISLFLVAQRTLPEFGNPVMSELQMKSCSFEPDANAMVLSDTREMDYEFSALGSKVSTVRRVRIKIFNEKGFAAATINIPYYSKKRNTKLSDLKGRVYNLDGAGNISTKSLEDADFFKDKVHSRVSILKFTFPDVKAGSVVEYTYTITDKERMDFDPWIIQTEIPVAYSSASITTPEFSRLDSYVFGNDTVSHKQENFKKNGPRVRQIFEKQNVKSFTAEPYMSSYNDNLLRVAFNLIENYRPNDFISPTPSLMWQTGGALLLRALGGFIEKQIPGTEKIIDSAVRIPVIKERIRFVYEHVRGRMKIVTGQSLIPEDITETWKDQAGNTASINVILLNLLKKADIPANPVLISTRNNGKINTAFPSPSQLNGIDVLVSDNGTYYLLDASLKYQSFQCPPFNVLNREGFLLSTRKMEWVSITDNRTLSSESNDVMAWFNDKGLLEGKSISRYYEYAKSYKLDTNSREGITDKSENKLPPGLTVTSTLQEDVDNDLMPLTETLEFTFEPNSSGDFYFINPLFLSNQKKNPFIKEFRITDIEFGCNQDFRYGFKLEIPPGYEPESLPKTVTIRAPDSAFYFKRVVTADAMNIYFSQNLEIRKPIFSRDEYAGIYEFYKHIYGLMNEEIVLKKKK